MDHVDTDSPVATARARCDRGDAESTVPRSTDARGSAGPETRVRPTESTASDRVETCGTDAGATDGGSAPGIGVDGVVAG